MDRLLSPFEGGAMVQLGYGLTNLVERATGRADELSIDGLKEGARLEENVRRYRPRCVALLGISAYRVVFRTPKATLGRWEGDIRSSPCALARWVAAPGQSTSVPSAASLRLFSEGPHLSRRAGQEHLGEQTGIHVINEAAHAYLIRVLGRSFRGSLTLWSGFIIAPHKAKD